MYEFVIIFVMLGQDKSSPPLSPPEGPLSIGFFASFQVTPTLIVKRRLRLRITTMKKMNQIVLNDYRSSIPFFIFFSSRNSFQYVGINWGGAISRWGAFKIGGLILPYLDPKQQRNLL